MPKPPLLPQKYFDWIETNWGLDEALKIDQEIMDGKRTADQVMRVIDRPDVEPSQWRSFEDGARPDRW